MAKIFSYQTFAECEKETSRNQTNQKDRTIYLAF